jgi:nicotinamide-nucleotide amidase
MNTEIINIGNELLIGQVVNTNASWMAEQLSLAGFRVHQVSVISDQPEHILTALKEAESRSSIVLVTGGLGPTKDDITKEAICNYFQTRLVFNHKAYESIVKLFLPRGFKVTDLNRKQAEVPESCIPLPNQNGTAPGIWIEGSSESKDNKTVFVFMPGVPFEMKPMMTDEVIPRLKERFKSQSIVHKTVLTQGVGESFLSDIIEEWELNLPQNISLAYLPQPGMVRLRLSGTGEIDAEVRDQVNREAEKLNNLIPDYIYGYDDDKLEAIIGRLLTTKNQTLSTAESCTGGYIAHLITSIPGSSGYFRGSVVAYDNEIKESELNVSHDNLIRFGAVSEQVVTEMARGIRNKFKTDYAIATSGIAGPDGGTSEKPVGTTWIAIATPEKVIAKSYLFGENRERNIRKTALQALNLLRKMLI